MTENVKKSLKKRGKLAKCCCRNDQKKEDNQKLLAKANNFKNEILEVKNGCILRMTNKGNKPNAVPKT